jgi:hypothetical protein
MALINTSVPNLIQGVSQQPDATRFDGQCEEQENALSSVAEGLKKRPNTRHVARLIAEAIDDESFVHFIDRDAQEKYVVIQDGTYLCAYNILTGQESSIKVGSNIYKKSWTAAELLEDDSRVDTGYPVEYSYLDTDKPRKALKGLSVGDSTFLLNKNVSVEPSDVNTDALDKEALVSVLQGSYSRSYTLDVNVSEGDSNVSLPLVTFGISRYQYDRWSDGRRIYRYRINSVSIANGGANLTDVTITTSSNSTIYRHPTFTTTITNGVLTGVSVVDGGDFKGRGGRHEAWAYDYDLPSVSDILSDNNSDATVYGLSARAATGENFVDGQTSTIATSLKASMQSSTGGDFDTYFDIAKMDDANNIILTLKDEYTDFTLSPSDSLGGDGLGAFYKQTSSITNLPANSRNGFRIKIKGDTELAQDDYYVRFETNTDSLNGVGSYLETVGFDIVKGYKNNTMPHLLVNIGADEFELKEALYEDRLAGDDETNPLPSFVGREINNVFFFKNRLGFLSRGSVILSESGLGVLNDQGNMVYNFGRTTVSSLLDSDPIDVEISSTRITELEAAVGFQENLILFAKNGQFSFKGSDLLTPKSVMISPITSFNYEDTVAPLPLGSYIYTPFTRGNYSGLREFMMTHNTEAYDAPEVTEHVPSYIPSNIIDMAGTTSEDMIALLSADEKGSLYIYNYFWNNQQKVLSAWSKFTFTGSIQGIEFIKSTLYLVITHNGETHLVEMPLESGLTDDAGYVTHLDNRVAVTVTNGSSTITLPYTPEDNSVEVYTTDGLALNCTNSGSTVTLSSPVLSDTDVWVGIPYTMKYTFSEQLFKAKAGNGKSPSNAAKMLIRNGSLYYDKSAYFKVKVTPKFRDTYENVFTPDVVGSSVLGSLSLDSGFYRFPVFTKPQDTTITIENESALPSTFQSAEFESFVHSRSNRYG